MHCRNPHFVGPILNWFLPFDVWWRFAPDLDVEESLSALVRLLVLLALLLVRACDEEHVADAGGVVHDALILIGGQHIP